MEGQILFIIVDPTPYGDVISITSLDTIWDDLTASKPSTKIFNATFYEFFSDEITVALYATPNPSTGPSYT